jgi:hypothetical protein
MIGVTPISQYILALADDPALRPWLGVPLAQLSTWDFRQRFTSYRPVGHNSPADIEAGADLVVWMAITVHRELLVPTVLQLSGGIHQGTPNNQTVMVRHFTKSVGRVFVHGIFFAHEAELAKFSVGTTDPQHFPTSEKSIRSAKQWYRTA